MKCNALGDFILPAGFMIIDEDKTDRLETLKVEAIERDYALYCPKDACKGECK